MMYLLLALSILLITPSTSVQTEDCMTDQCLIDWCMQVENDQEFCMDFTPSDRD